MLPLIPAPTVLDAGQSHSEGWEWMNSVCRQAWSWDIPPASQARAFPSLWDVWDEHKDLWEVRDGEGQGKHQTKENLAWIGIFGSQNFRAQQAKLYPKPNIPTSLFPEERGAGAAWSLQNSP